MTIRHQASGICQQSAGTHAHMHTWTQATPAPTCSSVLSLLFSSSSSWARCRKRSRCAHSTRTMELPSSSLPAQHGTRPAQHASSATPGPALPFCTATAAAQATSHAPLLSDRECAATPYPPPPPPPPSSSSSSSSAAAAWRRSLAPSKSPTCSRHPQQARQLPGSGCTSLLLAPCLPCLPRC
jgi:hypothetical protein